MKYYEYNKLLGESLDIFGVRGQCKVFNAEEIIKDINKSQNWKDRYIRGDKKWKLSSQKKNI